MILQLEHRNLAILFADLNVFLKRRNAKIRPALFAVDVGKQQIAQRVESAFFDNQIVNRHAARRVVVNADEFAVDRYVNVGFNAVMIAIARRDERRERVFLFDAAHAAMRDHQGFAGIDFDRVHDLYLDSCAVRRDFGFRSGRCARAAVDQRAQVFDARDVRERRQRGRGDALPEQIKAARADFNRVAVDRR